MKRLFAIALLALTSAAFGATLSPIQLLNPAGSTSGQVITSTGPTTAPAWSNVSVSALTGIVTVAHGGTNSGSASGTALDNITGFAGTGFLTRTGAGTYAFQSATNGITFGNLAQAGANTLLGNSTGSTANVAAVTVTGCNGAAQALQWTNGLGFGCNSGVATSGANANITSLTGLTTPLSVGQGGTGVTTSTGSGSVVLTTSPTITTPALVGITNGSTPASGRVGEFLSSGVATGSAVSLTTATAANVTSVSLTAGVWLCNGTVGFNISAGAAPISAWINTTGATQPAVNTGFGVTTLSLASGTFGGSLLSIMPTRINVSSSATAFLSSQASFASGTVTAYGFIGCRRTD